MKIPGTNNRGALPRLAPAMAMKVQSSCTSPRLFSWLLLRGSVPSLAPPTPFRGCWASPDVSPPNMARALCAEMCVCACPGQMALFCTAKTGVKMSCRCSHTTDCSFAEGSLSASSFYLVLPKQNRSHAGKRYNILAFPSGFRVKGSVRALVLGSGSLLGGEDESQRCSPCSRRV